MENNPAPAEDTTSGETEQVKETQGESMETLPTQTEQEPSNAQPEETQATSAETPESTELQLEETTSSSVQTEPPHEPEDLQGFLEMLKERPDVIGYVLRDKTATNIELKDPTKLIEYAILSSASIDAGGELSQIFYIGEVKRIMVSGKTVQVISMTMGENKISVFMEKDADPGEVLEKLENFKSRKFMGL